MIIVITFRHQEWDLASSDLVGKRTQRQRVGRHWYSQGRNTQSPCYWKQNEGQGGAGGGGEGEREQGSWESRRKGGREGRNASGAPTPTEFLSAFSTLTPSSRSAFTCDTSYFLGANKSCCLEGSALAPCRFRAPAPEAQLTGPSAQGSHAGPIPLLRADGPRFPRDSPGKDSDLLCVVWLRFWDVPEPAASSKPGKVEKLQGMCRLSGILFLRECAGWFLEYPVHLPRYSLACAFQFHAFCESPL